MILFAFDLHMQNIHTDSGEYDKEFFAVGSWFVNCISNDCYSGFNRFE